MYRRAATIFLFNVGKGYPGRWAKSLEGTLPLFVAAGASSVSLRIQTEPPLPEAESGAASGPPPVAAQTKASVVKTAKLTCVR